MKDIPHHMKKLNKKIIRSENREKKEEKDFVVKDEIHESEEQIKKKEKLARTNTEKEHIHISDNPDEMNKKMAKREPIIREREHPTSPSKP